MGTQCGFDNIDNGFDGVDVGDNLSNSLHGVSAVSEEKNGRLLDRGLITSRWLILI